MYIKLYPADSHYTNKPGQLHNLTDFGLKKKQRTNCNITAVINSWRCSTEYSRRQVPAVAMQRRARAGRAIKINDCSLLIVNTDRASLARQAVDDRRRPTTGFMSLCTNCWHRSARKTTNYCPVYT